MGIGSNVGERIRPFVVGGVMVKVECPAMFDGWFGLWPTSTIIIIGNHLALSSAQLLLVKFISAENDCSMI